MILTVRHGSPQVSDDPRSVTSGCLYSCWILFGDVIFDAPQTTEPVRGEREGTPFPAFVPSCWCCAFQLRRMQSLEQRTWAHVFGHRSRMITWITVWNRSTPHSACLNHRRGPVSTGIGLILLLVHVKQTSLIKTGVSFFMKSQHRLLTQFQL